MLSQLRRGHHHHEFDGGLMSARTINNHGEQWKPSERVKSSPLNNNLLPDVYPTATRSTSAALNPDLSRAFRVDAYLLAIIRIEDKRNPVYSTEVVTKLRQKEQTQSFINKPCSLFITERSFIIFDRGTQTIAESVPLENVDPTSVYSETTDTLNDIFMYRSIDRHLNNTAVTTNHSNGHESTSVIVFKCSNKESRLLVETIRGSVGRSVKTAKSVRSDQRSTLDRTGGMSFYDPQTIPHDHPPMMHPTYAAPPPPPPQQSSRSAHQTRSNMATADHYRRLTEELNKCFDDIELFVRYLESLVEYTKELDRDVRRKDRKSSGGLKKMVEELPADRFFIDILQKFKYSFNLLGELKHIIHNPNAPELIHYLLSPLQFIVSTLRSKHVNQLQIAQDIWTPPLTKESRELLINCLTSKEHEILGNLGPAWIATAEESPQKLHDYRPVFFEGRPLWFQEPSVDRPLPTTERQPSAWATTRSYNQNNNNNGAAVNPNFISPRQPSPAAHFDPSTVERPAKNGHLENYNTKFQNEHAWAIDRKQAGAKICAVKTDRKGQNEKELTVRRGELIEIENSSKKWWRAKNFRGEVGHVPHNIVEEIEIEKRTIKPTSANPAVGVIPRSSSAPTRGFVNVNGRRPENPENYSQHLLRSPSHGNNFIMQSNHSTSTNPTISRDQFFPQTFSPTISSISSPPPAPPMSFIPAPPPLPEGLLSVRSSLWSSIQLPNSARRDRSHSNTNPPTPRNDKLQEELTQRLTDRVGTINPNSSSEDVRRWLAAKQISPQLARNLQGMNGEELFQVSKAVFDQCTDETESTRIYTLISQQKKLSGYRSSDTSDHSPVLNGNAFGSLKARKSSNKDGHSSFRSNNSLTRSLKIKLKQRRDKIEQSEEADRN